MKHKGPTEIAIFPGKNKLDVSGELRRIASDIDAGEYGSVGCIGVVVMADRLTVLSAGPDSTGPSTATILYAGFQQLINALIEHNNG